MILLDTSACIEYLRSTGSVVEVALCALHDGPQFHELALCGPVVMELRMGAQSDRALSELNAWMMDLRYVPIEDRADFLEAARLYREARARGVTVRKPIDCLIAALAIRQDASLLHLDRDFDHLAKVSPLRVLDPAAVA